MNVSDLVHHDDASDSAHNNTYVTFDLYLNGLVQDLQRTRDALNTQLFDAQLYAYGGVMFEVAITNVSRLRDTVSIESSVLHLRDMEMGPMKISHVEHRPPVADQHDAVADTDALIEEVVTGGGVGSGAGDTRGTARRVQETNLGRVIVKGEQWRTVRL